MGTYNRIKEELKRGVSPFPLTFGFLQKDDTQVELSFNLFFQTFHVLVDTPRSVSSFVCKYRHTQSSFKGVPNFPPLNLFDSNRESLLQLKKSLAMTYIC